jgi:alpha-amylase
MHQQSAFWCLEDARDLITDRESWRRLQSTDHFTRMAIISGSCGRVAERRTSQEAYDYFSAYLRALARCEAACHAQIRSRLAAHALRCLPPDRAFHFHSGFRFTGYSAHSLKEFFRLLEFVPEDVFRFHQERGDFSRWITEVLGDTTLARDVAQCTGPGEAARVVRERVRELCHRLK